MIENVPVDALKALANLPGPSGGPTTEDASAFREVTATNRSGTFDLDQWLPDHGFKVVRKEPWNDGIRRILDCCPFNPEHDEPNKAIVGQFANGAIFVRCQHASCAGKSWHDMRDLAEPGWRDRGPKEAVNDPDRLARLFLERECLHPDGFTLRSYQGDWYAWNVITYVRLPAGELDVRLSRVIKPEFDRVSIETRDTACRVTISLLSNVRLALQTKILVPGDRGVPCWIGDGPWPASEILAAPNGLFHMPSLADGVENHVPTTPSYFSTFALDYEPRLDAPSPVAWLRFMEQLWGTDPACIETLQEFMGYFLVNDTSLQKILMLVGPKRSGKSTIAKVMTGLIGERNVAGPTVSSLKTNFGLQSLLGMPLAILADAQVSRNDHGVVEVLKMISGEDLITIDRKYAAPISVRLPTRLVYISNELPRFKDPSGALANRMIILRVIESFSGREDSTLGVRLLSERPGILIWAIAGWKRLMARSRFVQPESGLPLLSDLEDLSSPVRPFVRELCVVGSPQGQVVKQRLYRAYLEWCKAKGDDFPLADNTFGSALRAIVPGLGTAHPVMGDRQVWCYTGIALREAPVMGE